MWPDISKVCSLFLFAIKRKNRRPWNTFSVPVVSYIFSSRSPFFSVHIHPFLLSLLYAACSGLSWCSAPQSLAANPQIWHVSRLFPWEENLWSPICNTGSCAPLSSAQPNCHHPLPGKTPLPAPACTAVLSPAAATSPAGSQGPDDTSVCNEAQLPVACVTSHDWVTDPVLAQYPLGRCCRGRGDRYGEEARPYPHPQAVPWPRGSLWANAHSNHHPIHPWLPITCPCGSGQILCSSPYYLGNKSTWVWGERRQKGWQRLQGPRSSHASPKICLQPQCCASPLQANHS